MRHRVKQMHQIAALHDAYLYQIAHICIINLTKSTMWCNVVVLNILW